MPQGNIHISYMNIAKEIATRSYAERLKVGAILVKNNSIIADGYNGMPYGFGNNCETDGVTNVEVLHAESNAIAKISKSNQSSDGSVLYVTTSPCVECAKLIIQCGIKEVYFENVYRILDGINLLKRAGVKVFAKSDDNFYEYLN